MNSKRSCRTCEEKSSSCNFRYFSLLEETALLEENLPAFALSMVETLEEE